MNVSIIIPYHNDYDILNVTLPILLEGFRKCEGEVIIIDNGSFKPLEISGWPQVRIVRNAINIGVGGAFNQGVELARGDRIIFTATDVIPQEGWFERVNRTLEYEPNTIFSCMSSSFDVKDKRPFRSVIKYRYGASILYKMNRDHLSDGHRDKNDPKFHKILQAQWNESCNVGEKTYVECMLGAFYWMWKSDFQKINGWNGHRGWGSLEPFLSIKARAHGMHIIVDHKLDAAHYFGRKTIRSSRPDLQYYNMLFMAHTMFSEAMRDELIEYLECGDTGERLGRLNVNQAKQLIKRSMGLVTAERDYNNHHFKHGLISNWDKFTLTML